jgi:oligogalacturonide transport system permease protein
VSAHAAASPAPADRNTAAAWPRYVILAAVSLLMLYPLIWLVGATFKTNAEIFTEIGFWPSRLDFGAYARGWKTSTEYTFATYFINSFLITLPRIAVTVVSCVLVAYAFARFEFWGKKWLFAIMVGTMMLPLIVLRLPQYLMFRELGMLDSYWPLILPSAFATDTFFVFMLVQFLRGIPRDMEEAAMIDGCNALQMLWHIIVPLLMPAIVSVIVFQFIWTMNDFMGPLIYLASVENREIPGVARAQDEHRRHRGGRVGERDRDLDRGAAAVGRGLLRRAAALHRRGRLGRHQGIGITWRR